MTPEPTTISASPLVITLLTTAVVALAGAIVYLFKYYSGRLEQHAQDRRMLDERHAQERTTWAVERAKIEATLRVEYEAKHRALAESNAVAIRQLHDNARQEYAANMEVVADTANTAMDRLAVVLDKLYERSFGGSTRRAQSKG